MAEVVLFHHVQGLTDGVRAFADELGTGGHTVHTPDLFDGARPATIDDGVELVQRIGDQVLNERADRAVEDLPDGLVYAGFSFGAGTAQRQCSHVAMRIRRRTQRRGEQGVAGHRPGGPQALLRCQQRRVGRVALQRVAQQPGRDDRLPAHVQHPRIQRHTAGKAAVCQRRVRAEGQGLAVGRFRVGIRPALVVDLPQLHPDQPLRGGRQQRQQPLVVIQGRRVREGRRRRVPGPFQVFALLGAIGFELLKIIVVSILGGVGGSAFAPLAIAVTLLIWINYFSRLVFIGASWAVTSPLSAEAIEARRQDAARDTLDDSAGARSPSAV